MNTAKTTDRIARVVVCNQGIPSNLHGSWTQIIEYLLFSYQHNNIDYLLCGPSVLPFPSSGTTIRKVCNYWEIEINRSWFYTLKYRSYISALKSIITNHDFVLITVIDNAKLKNIVSDTIAKNGWQSKCRIIFIQCGFSYEFNRDEYKDFRTGLQEIVLLTQKSYEYELNKYHEYPFLVHVLHNPLRQDIFYKLSPEEKNIKRKQLGLLHDEKLFLWVSHDRPKKGLDIILSMWPQVHAKYPTAKLLIAGAKREMSLPGLSFLGKMPNLELAKYYQAADVFLFSSLCQEGFGLSLAEAMSCGCFCIASDVGGVSEFFSNAKNGILVTNPNQTQAWVNAIDEYMEQPLQPSAGLITPFLTYDEWCSRFQKIIDGSIEFLIQSANR